MSSPEGLGTSDGLPVPTPNSRSKPKRFPPTWCARASFDCGRPPPAFLQPHDRSLVENTICWARLRVQARHRSSKAASAGFGPPAGTGTFATNASRTALTFAGNCSLIDRTSFVLTDYSRHTASADCATDRQLDQL